MRLKDKNYSESNTFRAGQENKSLIGQLEEPQSGTSREEQEVSACHQTGLDNIT